MNAQGNLPRVIRARVEEDRSKARVSRRVIFGWAGEAERSISWEITGPKAALPSPLVRQDLAAAALIYLAMREGCDLHIEGAVSERLLENLDEFQYRWSLWRPDLYRVVQLSADAEIAEGRDRAERRDTAAITFSGGVDSTATILRHHAKLAGRASRRIKTAVLIKGFDIPLDRVEGWQVVVESAARTLADIGVPLCVVETNWRAATQANWEMEFAAGMLSCLHQWDEDVDTLIMAADYDYNHFVIPWGANPITNQLLASDDTSVPFDGGQFTRTEKVALIGQWPVGYDALRVCYEDDVSGRNCGVCRKCVMTKLNAIVSGLPVPASLYGPPTVADIKALNIVSPLLADTLATADRRGIRDPLFEALRSRQRTLKYLALAQRAKRKARHILKYGRW